MNKRLRWRCRSDLDQVVGFGRRRQLRFDFLPGLGIGLEVIFELVPIVVEERIGNNGERKTRAAKARIRRMEISFSI